MFANPPQWIIDLSNDSKRQLAWVIQSEGKNIAHQPLSDKSRKWIDKISDTLFDAKIPVYSSMKSDISPENLGKLIKIFKKSKFIDDIFIEIISNVTIKNSYKCLSNTNGHVTIDIVSAPDWPELDIKIIEGIFLVANILPKIFPWAKVAKYTHIQLIPCPVNKTFSSDGIWDPIHINSGFSSSEIVIWRRQEILKVAIHELLHLYSIDLSDEYFEKHDAFKTFENKNTPTNNTILEPRWNEGITEALATIIHISVMRHLYRIDLPHLYLMLDLERSHSKLMASLVYREKLPSNSRESTSVFSYFVIKALLIENLELLQDVLEKRSYQLFHQRVVEFIAGWSPIPNVPNSPFLRMSAIGL